MKWTSDSKAWTGWIPALGLIVFFIMQGIFGDGQPENPQPENQYVPQWLGYCATAFMFVLAIWVSIKLMGASGYKSRKPRATVLDGQTLLIKGSIEQISKAGIPGVVSWEHIAPYTWKLYLQTRHSNPDWHDEAESVANLINTASTSGF